MWQRPRTLGLRRSRRTRVHLVSFPFSSLAHWGKFEFSVTITKCLAKKKEQKDSFEKVWNQSLDKLELCSSLTQIPFGGNINQSSLTYFLCHNKRGEFTEVKVDLGKQEHDPTRRFPPPPCRHVTTISKPNKGWAVGSGWGGRSQTVLYSKVCGVCEKRKLDEHFNRKVGGKEK